MKFPYITSLYFRLLRSFEGLSVVREGRKEGGREGRKEGRKEGRNKQTNEGSKGVWE